MSSKQKLVRFDWAVKRVFHYRVVACGDTSDGSEFHHLYVPNNTKPYFRFGVNTSSTTKK